jgi:hypothetical protein
MPGALLAEEAAVIDRLNMIPLWTVLAVLGVCLSSHNDGATDRMRPPLVSRAVQSAARSSHSACWFGLEWSGGNP